MSNVQVSRIATGDMTCPTGGWNVKTSKSEVVLCNGGGPQPQAPQRNETTPVISPASPSYPEVDEELVEDALNGDWRKLSEALPPEHKAHKIEVSNHKEKQVLDLFYTYDRLLHNFGKYNDKGKFKFHKGYGARHPEVQKWLAAVSQASAQCPGFKVGHRSRKDGRRKIEILDEDDESVVVPVNNTNNMGTATTAVLRRPTLPSSQQRGFKVLVTPPVFARGQGGSGVNYPAQQPQQVLQRRSY